MKVRQAALGVAPGPCAPPVHLPMQRKRTTGSARAHLGRTSSCRVAPCVPRLPQIPTKTSVEIVRCYHQYHSGATPHSTYSLRSIRSFSIPRWQLSHVADRLSNHLPAIITLRHGDGRQRVPPYVSVCSSQTRADDAEYGFVLPSWVAFCSILWWWCHLYAF